MTSSPRTLILVLTASFSAMALDLSGTVTNPDGTPRSGVTVTLVSGGSTATTNATGQWSLNSSSVGVAGRAPRQALANHLSVVDGRLRLSWEGRGLSGRVTGISSGRPASMAYFARKASSAPDTLVYSIAGKVFLRDTVSASRSGIVGIYDTTWNAAVIYGWLKDPRDGRSYRTVKIGTQVWMAENLNYRNMKGRSDTVGECPLNSIDSCSKYGRLYSWADAMGVASNYNSTLLNAMLPLQGICPEGWHVPSEVEFDTLEDYASVGGGAGYRLKSTSGWSFDFADYSKDEYGFRALSTGLRYNSGGMGLYGYIYFWSSSESNEYGAWTLYMYTHDPGTVHPNYLKSNGCSIRCIGNK